MIRITNWAHEYQQIQQQVLDITRTDYDWRTRFWNTKIALKSIQLLEWVFSNNNHHSKQNKITKNTYDSTREAEIVQKSKNWYAYVARVERKLSLERVGFFRMRNCVLIHLPQKVKSYLYLVNKIYCIGVLIV